MLPSSLLLPSHGHAPYILGVNLLRNLNVNICVPHYYGAKQQQILMAEIRSNTDIADRIFLSESLGSLFKPLLRHETYSSSFHQYGQNIILNFAQISSDLQRKYRDGIEAISLSGVKKKFHYFDFALNTGLPVFSPVQPVVYVFAGKMSEIYRRAPEEDDHTRSLAKIWSQVESSFTHWFIPRLNSLWYLQYDNAGIIETPPLESQSGLDETDSVPPNSILVVGSGTHKGVSNLKELIASVSSKYHCITLAESSEKLGLPGFPPSVWGNPNVVAVLARSGFGTIWKALLNRKPIGVIKAISDGDPEVYHNAQVVNASGIGTILDDSLEPLLDALPQHLSRIQAQLTTDDERFKTMDGILYTSTKLKQLMSLGNEGIVYA